MSLQLYGRFTNWWLAVTTVVWRLPISQKFRWSHIFFHFSTCHFCIFYPIFNFSCISFFLSSSNIYISLSDGVISVWKWRLSWRKLALATDPILIKPHHPFLLWSTSSGTPTGQMGSALFRMPLEAKIRQYRNLGTGYTGDTTIGACTMRWSHWGGRGATDSLCHSSQTDNPYVLCIEKVGYERRSGDITCWLGGSLYLEWLMDPGELTRSSCFYNKIYLFTNQRSWSYDVGFDCCLRAHERGILAGWHNVGLLAILGPQRIRLYLRRLCDGNALNGAAFFRFPPLLSSRIFRTWSSIVVPALMPYCISPPSNFFNRPLCDLN